MFVFPFILLKIILFTAPLVDPTYEMRLCIWRCFFVFIKVMVIKMTVLDALTRHCKCFLIFCIASRICAVFNIVEANSLQQMKCKKWELLTEYFAMTLLSFLGFQMIVHSMYFHVSVTAIVHLMCFHVFATAILRVYLRRAICSLMSSC